MVQQEYIRFLYYQEGLSMREISRRTGHHRDTVRSYIMEPSTGYKRTAPIQYPVLGPYIETINNWLETDKSKSKKKEKHTAKRIYERLRDECGFCGGQSTVREYVRKWRQLSGETDVYLPLRFAPGESMQVDWGFVPVTFQNATYQLPLFCARLANSTAIFVRLYPHSRKEAFLDGLQHALEFFGGVPKEVVFDNLRTAIKNFVWPNEREETAEFLAFRTHYVFRARFCNPGKGNEKGLVENLVGYSRRNFFVPAPTVDGLTSQELEPLNVRLMELCIAKRSERRADDERTVGELFEEERRQMLQLPARRYDCAIRRVCSVDSCSRIHFENNAYSVPYTYAHRSVELKVFVDKLEVVSGDKVIASHRRSYGRYGQFLDLNHYLEVLQRKPGALRHFRGWQDSDLPKLYQRLLDTMADQKHSVKDFISVLILRRDHGDPQAVDDAVRLSFERNCPHLEAIKQLLGTPANSVKSSTCAQVPDQLRDARVAPPQPAVYQRLLEVAS